MELFFWVSLFIIWYTYIGYGVFIYLVLKLKNRIFKPKASISFSSENLPTCTLVIAAYNEEDFILKKIKNTLDLVYPAALFKVIFVTDGSTDQTPTLLANFPQFTHLHHPERKGKVAAMERAMNSLDSEIVVFTDANTLLNKEAILEICHCYADSSVGGVAGEKRVSFDDKADASAAGEGIYWKYESQLKKWDSELYSVVGTAGELFSVRKSLYQPVPEDTLLDDFTISMQIAEKGYRIVYQPKAFAVETSSANVKEELKRKIRIAAGGMQAIFRLSALLNPMHHPLLTFQYVSHRVLRWTVTPLLILVVFFLNVILVAQDGPVFYSFLLALQLGFYALAIIGWWLEKKQLKYKATFIPYYFCMMNYAVLAGMVRYFKNKQSVAWEKAKRRD